MFSLQQVIKFEEMVGKGQANIVDDTNFAAQYLQFLKHWLCEGLLGTIMEKNWGLPIGWCRQQVFYVTSHRFADHTSQMSWFPLGLRLTDYQTVTVTYLW